MGDHFYDFNYIAVFKLFANIKKQ